MRRKNDACPALVKSNTTFLAKDNLGNTLLTGQYPPTAVPCIHHIPGTEGRLHGDVADPGQAARSVEGLVPPLRPVDEGVQQDEGSGADLLLGEQRRIKTEEKAKVFASVCGGGGGKIYFIPFF